jgi:acetyltransferase-like isoleucine patch superfamily enzyme
VTGEKKLHAIEKILDQTLDAKRTGKILKMLGAGDFPADILDELKIYCDYLPKAQEIPYSKHQRYLHFLWSSLDKLPIGTVAGFAIPFRRMIAERLFKKCGKNFTADENVVFNFGNNIEIGGDVFINRGVFIDSKGGVRIGGSSGIAEFVVIFTHSHSESDHAERTYAPVVIEDHVKIYTEAMILPGVTIHKEAIVAAKSLVADDVPAGMVVAGTPAKPMRARKTLDKSGSKLNHVWFYKGAFQNR